MALGPVAASPSAVVDRADPIPAFQNASTHAGSPIAPRYLAEVGDLDVSLLGSFVQYPGIRASLLGSELGVQYRLSESLSLKANLGHTAAIGLRGPLIEASAFRLGWDVHYRSDWYFLTASGMGLGAPAYGVIPVPGGAAHGMELSLNAMQAWQQWAFYLSPSVSLMSNRSLAGMNAGVDLNLGRFGLGYAFGHHQVLHNPDPGASSLVPSEQAHRLGVRWAWSKDGYIHLHAMAIPQDTYGIPLQGLMAGIGWRFSGFPAASPRVPDAVAPPLESPLLTLDPTPLDPEVEPSPSEWRPVEADDAIPRPKAEPVLEGPFREAIALPPVASPTPPPMIHEGRDSEGEPTPAAIAPTSEAAASPFAPTDMAWGPFVPAPQGPFMASAMQASESLEDRTGDSGHGLFSMSAASGVLSAAQDAANGGAAAVAIVVCCLLLLGTGGKSEDDDSRQER
ncbi:hypothetical protein D3C86_287790 [compost metagenome]